MHALSFGEFLTARGFSYELPIMHTDTHIHKLSIIVILWSVLWYIHCYSKRCYKTALDSLILPKTERARVSLLPLLPCRAIARAFFSTSFLFFFRFFRVCFGHIENDAFDATFATLCDVIQTTFTRYTQNRHVNHIDISHTFSKLKKEKPNKSC